MIDPGGVYPERLTLNTGSLGIDRLPETFTMHVFALLSTTIDVLSK
jgi:hypothetical protein